jgi:arginine-tRNA-protein transferase
VLLYHQYPNVAKEQVAVRDPQLAQVEQAAFLGTSTDACPYLPDKVASLYFCNGLIAGQHYRDLLDAGYRRNGMYLYRPVCTACQACEVIRVPVAQFRRSKSQRRVWNRCHGRFKVSAQPPSCTPEKVALYERYLAQHHGDTPRGDVTAQYTTFLVETCLPGHTIEMQFRHEGRLVAVGILDHVDDALSSVYFYFDPDYAAFGLGTYSALLEIALAREWGLQYYYLGYYIAGCRAMNYKNRFLPCELKAPDATNWRSQSAR